MNKKLFLLMLMLPLLFSCGQRGPLYLPEEPVQEAQGVQSDKAAVDADVTVTEQE